MRKSISEYRKIFEDNTLSDQEKYNKINDLQSKKILNDNFTGFCGVIIGLNLMIWPSIFIINNLENDKSNLRPIATLKN